MDSSSVRQGAQRARSREMMRPFRTSIRALVAGCLLLGLVVMLHEESPFARLVAERATSEPMIDGSSRAGTLQPGAVSALFDDVATVGPGERDQQAVTPTEAGMKSDGVLPPSGKDTARFWNASQSVDRADRGPTVQIGPLVVANGPAPGAGSQPPVKEFVEDKSPLVTRTYRPVSISAAGLERLVRPLLTARGVAANGGSPVPNEHLAAADMTRAAADAESTDRPGVLIVSDRPEAIGRVDALCHDLESLAPRIAIDLVVVNIVPNEGRQLPWDQWRNSFGIVDSDLPTVVRQVRELGRTTVRASSQLQGMSGTWTELEWSEQNLAPRNSLADLSASADREATSPTVISSSAATTLAPAVTTLRVRPTNQPEGTIRLEVRAQSSRLEERAHAEHAQLVTVRLNTEVVLREGATGVINLFVDEASDADSTLAKSFQPAIPALVIPGGPSIPPTKIVPQSGQREQTLLLLMPRIVGAPRPPGKVATSKAHEPR
jgi:hypothetical protein